MERIRELIEELQAAVQEVFPEMTVSSVTMGSDGYRYINVLKWDGDNDKPAKDRKRRNLLDQAKCGGEWGDDLSGLQNDFLKKSGHLLGGC